MEDGGETQIYGRFRKEENEIGTLKRLDIEPRWRKGEYSLFVEGIIRMGLKKKKKKNLMLALLAGRVFCNISGTNNPTSNIDL